MSGVLKDVFERASKLSDTEQEALARIVAAEIEEIGRRAGPESALARLGREAWVEHDEGRTRPLP